MRGKVIKLFLLVIAGTFLAAGPAASAQQVELNVTTKEVTVTETKPPLEKQEVTVTEIAKDPASNAGEGEPRVSEEEVLKIIRGAFPEIARDENPEIHLVYEQYLGRNVWYIEARESMRYGPGIPPGYNAAVDADTGEILRIHWRNKPSGETKGVISRGEAQKIAEQFVRKLQPERYKHLQLQTGPAELYYSSAELNIAHFFNWARTENRIAVDGDGIRVAVDALSGQVNSYNYTWRPDIKLPARGAATVPAEELSGKIIKELGMALVYQVPYRNYTVDIPEAKLIYQVNGEMPAFNAYSGKALDYQGKEKEFKDILKYENTPGVSGVNNPPPSSGKRISMEKAKEEAAKFFRLLGTEGEVERSGSGSSGGPLGRQETWGFSISTNNSIRHYSHQQVDIDVITGRVISYHTDGSDYRDGSSNSSDISREEALEKAKAFIKLAAPEYSSHVAPEKAVQEWFLEKGPKIHHFHFYRIVNGIPFPQDGIYIEIGSDGKVLSYHCEWHRVTFPEPKALIPPEEAAKKWLELTPLKLTYFFPREGENQSNEAVLAYQWDYSGSTGIDANSGEPVNYEGQSVKQKTANGYQIENSWAAQYLEILAGSGLLPPRDRFSPTTPVKKRDAARIMTASMNHVYGFDGKPVKPFQDVNQDDPDFNAIQSGALLGMYEKGGNFNPDQNITRLTLAKWMVNAMGYGDVAKMKNTINSTFKDISDLSATDRNYIGIVQGLGMMQGDESGKFNPNDNVTWEELAAIVIKSAPVLRNKQVFW